MTLPSSLQRAIESFLDGVSFEAVAKSSKELSRRYGEGPVPGDPSYLRSEMDLKAYIAMRMPSIYAVLQAIFMETERSIPDFAPKSLLDIGAGPGTALWAVAERWDSVEKAVLLDSSEEFRKAGRSLAAFGEKRLVPEARWKPFTIAPDSPLSFSEEETEYDLVTASYVLGELSPAAQRRLVDAMWRKTDGVALLVEPGTPEGSRRIIAARAQLLAEGATIAAPCPHACACPLRDADGRDHWCHFGKRVERTKAQRLAKGGRLGYEDEKYSYVAAVRGGARREVEGRLIRDSRRLKYGTRLTLCHAEGEVKTIDIGKKDPRWKEASKLAWGEALRAR